MLTGQTGLIACDKRDWAHLFLRSLCSAWSILHFDWAFLCLVLVEPKAPCYRAHFCVRNSGFSRILSLTTRDHFRAMFVWFSYPEKTWRRWQLFATIAPCAHITHLVNDVGKFSMFKINLSYFPSTARLNFRWIFKTLLKTLVSNTSWGNQHLRSTSESNRVCLTWVKQLKQW